MNYRDLRHVLTAGASRLVLSIEGEEADTGGAGGAEETLDPGPADDGGSEGEAGDEPAAEAPAAEPAEAEPEPAPEPKSTRVPWQTKRIDKLTAEARAAQEAADAARAEAAESRRQLDAYRALYGTDAIPPAGTPAAAAAAAEASPGGQRTYTESEVNNLVAERARLQTIDQTLNRWYEDGVKTEGDAFKTRIAQVGQAFGADLVKRVDFFEAITSLPNGAAVYDKLAGDLDHFAEVLSMNPLQLGLELGRLSTAAAAKPAARKEVSRVPAPITPVDGSGGREFDPETASMEDYVKVREAQREARWKEKGYA